MAMHNKNFDINRLVDALGLFGKARILVLGDVMLDRFIWGRVDRISPEAPVPVVDVDSETYMLGGAANVVHNLIALGAQASICGAVGDDEDGRQVTALLEDLEVPTGRHGDLRGPAHHGEDQGGGPQPADGQGGPGKPQSPPSRKTWRRFVVFWMRILPAADALIISDYAKGVVSRPLMEHLKKLATANDKRWAVDPKVVNMPLYSGATIVTPNHLEAAAAAGIVTDTPDYVDLAGAKLLKDYAFQAVLITQGERGMTVFTGPEQNQKTHIPTTARRVFDVTGAGDTVISTLTLGMVAGLDFAEAALLANFAAGVVVGEVGTSAVTAGRLAHAVREEAHRMGLGD